MTNKIEILSPGPGCHRTQKIINWIKTILERNKADFNLDIITNQDLFTNYNTWILPTVIINNQIVSRGYKPSEQQIIKAIKQVVGRYHIHHVDIQPEFSVNYNKQVIINN